MRYQDCVVAWNPGTDQVRVGPLIGRDEPDWTAWPINYVFTGGATYKLIREHKDEFFVTMILFIEFNTLVLRDRVPPEAVHKAFLAIDEYRRRIASEIPGADLD